MANKWQPSACLFPTPSFYRLSQIANRSFAGSYNNDYNNDRDSDYNQRGGSRGGYNQGGRDRGNYQQNDRFESRSSYRDSAPEQNVQDYVSYSDKIQRLTYEDLSCEEVTVDILDQQSKNMLDRGGITELFPVQKAAYKLFVEGEELIVKSKTGSGKTLAFLLPLQELLSKQPEESRNQVLAVILEPTRELAVQVADQIQKFSKLRCALFFGGGNQKAYHNMNDIRRIKPQIIVATPGRFIDLLENHGLNIETSKYQILDEGDKMLDMGFQQDIIKIQRFMPQSQTMIFSATIPAYIQEIARRYMKNPIMLDLVGKDSVQMPDTISNEIVLCKDFTAKQAFIKKFITANRELKVIIFAETKVEVKRYERQRYAEFGCLQGDLEQNARQRILQDYRHPSSQMTLVATDVAARGLDIDNIDVVIHQSVNNVDSFIHRTGRTGRAGKNGRNIVLFEVSEDKQNLDFFKQIEKSLKCSFKYTNVIVGQTAQDKTELAEQEQLEVNRIVKKVQYQSVQAPSVRLNSAIKETAVVNMMEWFVDLDAESQQNLLQSVFTEKLVGRSYKSDESIGLLSFKEGDRSFHIENVSSSAMNHLRNTCQSKHIKYISNQQGEILMDIGVLQESQKSEIQSVLDQHDPECQMLEVSHIPTSLKQDFYRTLSMSGQMSRKTSGHGGSRRGSYQQRDYGRGNDGYQRGNGYDRGGHSGGGNKYKSSFMGSRGGDNGNSGSRGHY